MSDIAHPFLTASTWPATSTSNTFVGQVEPAWFQGKGAFGGLQCAAILRAMASVVGDARRRPRTLHAHFCAPMRAGRVDLAVVQERAGATISTLSARATQEGGAVCVASATFALERPRPEDALRYVDIKPPQVPPPLECEPTPRDIPLMPAFTQFWDYRFCLGDTPFSGSSRSLIGGWLRLAEPLAYDAPLVAACVDAYPPALLPRLQAPRQASSVDITIEFLADPPAADAYVLVVQTSRTGDGGTTDERCDLWSQDGRLVAAGRQLVALL